MCVCSNLSEQPNSLIENKPIQLSFVLQHNYDYKKKNNNDANN